MGVLKQQKETLSGLFYNDFKKIFCEGGGGRWEAQTNPLSLSKYVAFWWSKHLRAYYPHVKKWIKSEDLYGSCAFAY